MEICYGKDNARVVYILYDMARYFERISCEGKQKIEAELSLQYYRRWYRVKMKGSPGSASRQWSGLNRLAVVHARFGMYIDAILLKRKSMAIRIKDQGYRYTRNSNYFNDLETLADYYLAAGKKHEEAKCLRQSLRLRQVELSKCKVDSWDYAFCLKYISRVLKRLGRLDEAKKAYDKAVELYPSLKD